MSSSRPAQAPGTPKALSLEERKLVAELVADGLSIQDEFSPEPLHKETSEGHVEDGAIDHIQRLKEQPNGANHERE